MEESNDNYFSCQKFVFGTKAETLARLSRLVQAATILPLHWATYKEWKSDKEKLINRVQSETWGNTELIVRSSACSEDFPGSSNAGKYRTLLNVIGRDQIIDAVNSVFASYLTPTDQDQVLVQPQISDIRLSGVASSIDPSNNSPYRIINWVRGSDTTAVTSGKGTNIHTWYGVRGFGINFPNKDIAKVFTLIDELEKITNMDALEIEFGVQSSGKLLLFQVRQLPPVDYQLSHTIHLETLKAVAHRISIVQTKFPNVLGERTVFGVMPDWNPAEMIGTRPRPLALSLYKTLITNNVYATARKAYGYRDVGDTPLMVEFFGIPYIDVRASFTSLIPSDLEEHIAQRLVKYYIEKLEANPSLHDKVEFEIVLSCYTPTFGRKQKDLSDFSSFERKSIADSLRRLTERLLSKSNPCTEDIKQIQNIKLFPIQNKTGAPPNIRYLNNLLEICKQYGTLPFAGLARAAFVAMEFLNGLVEIGILTYDQKMYWVAALDNITSMLVDEFYKLTKKEFLSRYGHLRPGTYDILSPRYDEQPERYFNWSTSSKHQSSNIQTLPITLAQRKEINKLLKKMGLNCNSTQLFQFMSTSIKGRENAKFQFTRLVSEFLKNIQTLGAHYGFSPDDMSYLDIEFIRTFQGTELSRDVLMKEIEIGQQKYEITKSIMLPPTIFSPDNIWGFEYPETEPNFVTQKRCVARIANIENGDIPDGAIAFIKSADPGYDWLFARRIVGLVTAYGGYNSHMAIRAIEFNIPAAIGVGEVRFCSWLSAGLLELDAGNRCIRSLP